LKTVTFDKSKLLSMSKDGLEYVDDQGCRCTIDFHTCRENFKKKHVPERLWDRVSDYVTVRDIEAKPPHITFATCRFAVPHSRHRAANRRPTVEAGSRRIARQFWQPWQSRSHRGRLRSTVWIWYWQPASTPLLSG
jgi:hypothetical protein